MQHKLMRGLFFFGGLAIGLLLFGFFVWREGWETVLGNVIAFGILPILGFTAISLANFCLYAKRWQIVINAHLPKSQHVSFWRVYMHRMAGYAVGYLTPATQIAGEPIRVALHVRDGVPAKEATSAAVLDIAFESLAYVLFVVIGVVLAVSEGLGGGQMQAVLIGLGAAIIFLMIFFVSIRGGHGFFQHVFRFKSVARVEDSMSQFLARNPRELIVVGVISVFAISFKIIEVFYLAWFFGVPLSFGQAFLVSTLPGVALLLPIPGGLGAFEGGFAAVFTALGIPLDPVAFALIIRLRDAIFIGIGGTHIALQGGDSMLKKLSK